MQDKISVEFSARNSSLDAVSSMLTAFILLYLGFELLPQGIRCKSDLAGSAGCFAEAVRLIGGPPIRLDLEGQAMLALAAFGAAGGLAERSLRPNPLLDQGTALGGVRLGRILGRLLPIVVAALAGALAAVIIPSLLIDSPTPYAEVDVEALAVVAFFAGFGMPRLIPDLIRRTEPRGPDGALRAGMDVSESAARSEDAAVAMREIAARLDMIFDQPTLDNWCGRVAVSPQSGEWVGDGDDERIEVAEGQSMPLRILFEPMACSEDPAPVISEKIDISGGNATDNPVLFNVALDGRGFDPAAPSARGTVEAPQSGRVEIVLDPGRLMAGTHDIIVEITQKGRLIQTLIVPVLVATQSAEA